MNEIDEMEDFDNQNLVWYQWMSEFLNRAQTKYAYIFDFASSITFWWPDSMDLDIFDDTSQTLIYKFKWEKK